jgi:hypothetical protein
LTSKARTLLTDHRRLEAEVHTVTRAGHAPPIEASYPCLVAAPRSRQ